MPPKREPNTTDRLTMLGPGRKWQSAKVSLNSSAVIQRCSSTMPRRAKASTPPKPASDILANARNSVMRPGAGVVLVDKGRSGAAGADEGISEDIGRFRTPERPRPTQFGVFRPDLTDFSTGKSDTVFSIFCPLYWGCRFAGYGNKS